MLSFRHKYVKVCLILSLICVAQVKSEYYSSIDALQKLVKAENELLQVYRQYLTKQRKQLESYRRFIAQVQAEHDLLVAEVFANDAINAYKLIKRVASDWTALNGAVKEKSLRNSLYAQIEELQKKTAFPNMRDVDGAATGIARLQEIYALDAADLMTGTINGTSYGTKLTWGDAYILGSSLFEQQNYAQSRQWLERVFVALQNNSNNATNAPQGTLSPRKTYLHTLEYLALLNYYLKNIPVGISYREELLAHQPQRGIKSAYDVATSIQAVNIKLEDRREKIDWYANYTRLCRGIKLPEARKPSLKCFLTTKQRPYFTLAPLKVEELSVEPEINMHHGILTDAIIERLVAQAREAEIIRSGFGDGVNETRISQQAWLEYDTPVTRLIYNLVTDASGLDLKNAEILQVANYGIGGQFEAHCDTLGYAPHWLIGDRMATAMFYLSDVEQGGYTIFPNLNMYIRPVKGSLILWFNVHRSLDDDNRSMHAGCPLMKGTKRIGNIWIHTGFQEFLRPCELRQDNYKSFGYTCNE